MTDGERECLKLLAGAWNAFNALEVQHGDDGDEFRRSIHAAQNIIAFRVARRVDPKDWN